MELLAVPGGLALLLHRNVCRYGDVALTKNSVWAIGCGLEGFDMRYGALVGRPGKD